MFFCYKVKGVEYRELFWITLKGKKMLIGRGIKMYRVIVIVENKNNVSLE